MVVVLDDIGPSTAKSVSRFEKVDQLQGSHMIADVLAGPFQLFPLAFLHHHMVPFSSQQLRSLLGEAVHIVHRSVQEAKVGLAAARVAGWTPVPETSMELVDSVGIGIEPVHSDAGVWQLVLALVEAGPSKSTIVPSVQNKQKIGAEDFKPGFVAGWAGRHTFTDRSSFICTICK